MTRNDVLRLFLAAALVWPAAALAQEDDDDPEQSPRSSGGQAKLKAILRNVRGEFPGEVVSVRFLAESDRYRIKILSSDDRLITLTVDAGSGEVLSVVGR